MPIRIEDRDRYPDDWPQISHRIKERAGWACEKCRVPNGEVIRRGVTEDGQAVWRYASDSSYMDGYCAETGEEVPDTGEDTVGWGNPVKVVLTVAHLDHMPENCDPQNLRAWCQRCHNRYDAPMRRAGIKARQKAACADADMFPAPLVGDVARGGEG